MAKSSGPETQAAEHLFQTGLRLHQEGQLQRAEHLYREVLRQRPRHADALNMLGVIACQTRNFAAGIDLIRQALAITPAHADYLNNLGQACLELGQRELARDSFERAVAARPRFAEAHLNLANWHLAAGERDQAESHLRKALRARPDYVDALNNLGNLLRQTGRADEATPLLRRLVQQMPAFAQGHYNLALALQAQALYDEAVAAFERALALEPASVPMWEALGSCQRQRGALAAAEAAFRAALERAPEHARLWNELGIAQFAQNRAADALASFERAAACDRGQAVSLTHAGMAHAALGHADAARRCFEQALVADPAWGEAYRHLAEMSPAATEAQELIARIDAALAQPERHVGQHADLQFARGRLADELGDYPAAFRAFSAANAARRARVRYNAEAQARYVDAIMATFDADYLARYAAVGSDSRQPIFIVGMPRSGTTLVEQILASHAAVHGAGELTYFPEQVARLQSRLGARKPFPACVAAAPAEIWAEIAAGYLALLTGLAPRARHVTDKMPYNFLYLGLIACTFPQARVVHCRRSPMATCFSLYTRDLAGSHPYAYDLEALGAAYRGYARLMNHWRGLLGPRLVELDYEALVATPEPVIRTLLAGLDLDWDARCLAFHRTERTVVTASQWQVRRPMYGSARAHWQAYEKELEPLARALGPELAMAGR